MKKSKKQKEYTIKWEIQVDSTSKKNAAKIALQMMRDKNSTATVLSVVEFNNTADEPEEFDLSEDKSEKIRYIKKVLDTWGGTSTSELELDHSPSLNSMAGGNIAELVEEFTVDGVSAVTYDDDMEIGWNDYSYDELPDDVIDEIVEIMENYEADQEQTAKRCEN